ncbi:MAG: DNA mismatch repair protein MutS2, partial [Candidatus Krumholzibacteriia bacterium]
MITLLQQFHSIIETDQIILSRRSATLLEWEEITAQIAAHCINRFAAKDLRSRLAFASLSSIQWVHEITDELGHDGASGLWPPVVEVGDLLEIVRRPPPVRLEGTDLVHVAAVASEFDDLRQHFLASRDRFPRWSEAAIQMNTFDSLTAAINRALDLDGRIKDSASPLLSRLRRSAGSQERAVRQEVGSAMSQAKREGWTTGDEAALRGDRFCLPLRSGDSRRVPGIVHDRSTTGATLFVEPAGVMRLSNELASTRLEIAAEETRIIFELNQLVEKAASALDEAAQLMVLVDTVRAPMLWSRQVRGHRVHLSEAGTLRVIGGRHPLLSSALGDGEIAAGRDHVVPLDLELKADERVLVISGPNAGGKSVALKSVGVFCLLAQCGWDVPAREDTVLPLTNNLMADLGDDQSIAEALSSFSAHLRHLSGYMKDAAPGALILCDEIGSGTDPQEGTALAFAVLENFAASGARVLASTHFGLLKAAVHDHPDMVNAAMDYDERDLRPLFTFRVGDPGTSHAFDIAGRMGFSEDLLARAREMAGEERVQVERLLIDLDQRARELATAQTEVRDAVASAQRRDEELARRLKGLKKESRELLAKARREAADVVRQGRRAVENAVRDIKSAEADKVVVKTARDRLDRLSDELAEAPDQSPAPKSVEVGQRVRIPHLGLIGNVVEVRGKKLVALADGLRLNLALSVVRHLDVGMNTEAKPIVVTAGSKP